MDAPSKTIIIEGHSVVLLCNATFQEVYEYFPNSSLDKRSLNEMFVQFRLLSFYSDKPSGSALTTTPGNTTVLRGSTVSLNCSTDANPDAHVYQFYLNDTKIGNSSSGVFNVTVKADGVYTCVPINTAGTGHNATVSVTAVGKSVQLNVQDL